MKQNKAFLLTIMMVLIQDIFINAFCQYQNTPENFTENLSDEYNEKRAAYGIEVEAFSFEKGINILNGTSPLHLHYNADVERTIQYYLSKRTKDIEIYLRRGSRYFPLIEEMLDKYDLPLELKYVAVVESGLNPFARSSSGATGLWQFLYSTCSLFDLQVDSYIDERRDVYLSTEAACRYFQYLYRTFNDWELVLASYCNGPGEVRKAIARSGGKTGYWEIRPYLSEQARNYVPVFTAICYLMHFHKQYHLVPARGPVSPLTDSIKVHYHVTFQQIESVLNLSAEEIQQLNPVYRKGIIPGRDKPCILVLPEDLISEYLLNEDKITSSAVHRPDYNDLVAYAGNTAHSTMITHVVKAGEGLHKIAIHYNCTLENLRAWNDLSDLNTFPGQELKIWVRKQDP